MQPYIWYPFTNPIRVECFDMAVMDLRDDKGKVVETSPFASCLEEGDGGTQQRHRSYSGNGAYAVESSTNAHALPAAASAASGNTPPLPHLTAPFPAHTYTTLAGGTHALPPPRYLTPPMTPLSSAALVAPPPPPPLVAGGSTSLYLGTAPLGSIPPLSLAGGTGSVGVPSALLLGDATTNDSMASVAAPADGGSGSEEAMSIAARQALRHILYSTIRDVGLRSVLDGCLLPPPLRHPDLHDLDGTRPYTRAEVVAAARQIPREMVPMLVGVPLNFALATGVYDARLRAAIKRLAHLLDYGLADVLAKEEVLCSVDVSDIVTLEANGMRAQILKDRKGLTVKRIVAIGAFTVIGGAALVVTGGMMAPIVAPAFAAVVGAAATSLGAAGALGATALGGTALAGFFAGVVGVATHTAAMGVIITPILSVAHLTALFGIGGAGLGAYKANRRFGDLEGFAIRPIDAAERLPPMDVALEDVADARLDAVVAQSIKLDSKRKASVEKDVVSGSQQGLVVPVHVRSLALLNMAGALRYANRRRLSPCAVENRLPAGLRLDLAAVKLTVGVWAHFPPHTVPSQFAGLFLSHNRPNYPTGTHGYICYKVAVAPLATTTSAHRTSPSAASSSSVSAKSRSILSSSSVASPLPPADSIAHLSPAAKALVGASVWLSVGVSFTGGASLLGCVLRLAKDCPLANATAERRNKGSADEALAKLLKDLDSEATKAKERDFVKRLGPLEVEGRLRPKPHVIVRLLPEAGVDDNGRAVMAYFHERELKQQMGDAKALADRKSSRVVLAVIKNSMTRPIVSGGVSNSEAYADDGGRTSSEHVVHEGDLQFMGIRAISGGPAARFVPPRTLPPRHACIVPFVNHSHLPSPAEVEVMLMGQTRRSQRLAAERAIHQREQALSAANSPVSGIVFEGVPDDIARTLNSSICLMGPRAPLSSAGVDYDEPLRAGGDGATSAVQGGGDSLASPLAAAPLAPQYFITVRAKVNATNGISGGAAATADIVIGKKGGSGSKGTASILQGSQQVQSSRTAVTNNGPFSIDVHAANDTKRGEGGGGLFSSSSSSAHRLPMGSSSGAVSGDEATLLKLRSKPHETPSDSPYARIVVSFDEASNAVIFEVKDPLAPGTSREEGGDDDDNEDDCSDSDGEKRVRRNKKASARLKARSAKKKRAMTLVIAATGYAAIFDPRLPMSDQQVAMWQRPMDECPLFNTSEQFVLEWEEEHQSSFYALVGMDADGSAAEYAEDATKEAIVKETKSRLMHTALFAVLSSYRALTAAFEVPMYAWWFSDAIDNSFAMLRTRAKLAGRELAAALLSPERGNRPVTLNGYSFGANVMFECLLALFEANALSIVEDVYLLGACLETDREKWRKARQAVGGRLVNVYNRGDLTLRLFHRGNSWGHRPLAGLCQVSLPGVENVDASAFVKTHGDYARKLAQIFTLIPPQPTPVTCRVNTGGSALGARVPAADILDAADKVMEAMLSRLSLDGGFVLSYTNRLVADGAAAASPLLQPRNANAKGGGRGGPTAAAIATGGSSVYGAQSRTGDVSFVFVGERCFDCQFDFAPPGVVDSGESGVSGILCPYRSYGPCVVAGFAAHMGVVSDTILVVLVFTCYDGRRKEVRGACKGLVVPARETPEEDAVALGARLQAIVEHYASDVKAVSAFATAGGSFSTVVEVPIEEEEEGDGDANDAFGCGGAPRGINTTAELRTCPVKIAWCFKKTHFTWAASGILSRHPAVLEEVSGFMGGGAGPTNHNNASRCDDDGDDWYASPSTADGSSSSPRNAPRCDDDEETAQQLLDPVCIAAAAMDTPATAASIAIGHGLEGAGRVGGGPMLGGMRCARLVPAADEAAIERAMVALRAELCTPPPRTSSPRHDNLRGGPLQRQGPSAAPSCSPPAAERNGLSHGSLISTSTATTPSSSLAVGGHSEGGGVADLGSIVHAAARAELSAAVGRTCGFEVFGDVLSMSLCGSVASNSFHNTSAPTTAYTPGAEASDNGAPLSRSLGNSLAPSSSRHPQLQVGGQSLLGASPLGLTRVGSIMGRGGGGGGGAGSVLGASYYASAHSLALDPLAASRLERFEVTLAAIHRRTVVIIQPIAIANISQRDVPLCLPEDCLTLLSAAEGFQWLRMPPPLIGPSQCAMLAFRWKVDPYSVFRAEADRVMRGRGASSNNRAPPTKCQVLLSSFSLGELLGKSPVPAGRSTYVVRIIATLTCEDIYNKPVVSTHITMSCLVDTTDDRHRTAVQCFTSGLPAERGSAQAEGAHNGGYGAAPPLEAMQYPCLMIPAGGAVPSAEEVKDDLNWRYF